MQFLFEDYIAFWASPNLVFEDKEEDRGYYEGVLPKKKQTYERTNHHYYWDLGGYYSWGHYSTLRAGYKALTLFIFIVSYIDSDSLCYPSLF